MIAMARRLAPFRGGLDVMASPVSDRPGVLIRDPFRYTDSVLIIPPPLVPLLALFNGERTDLDLREALVRLTGRLEVGTMVDSLVATLSDGGFLEDETFERARQERHRAFAEATLREPAHAGSAYPEVAEDLRSLIASVLDGAQDAVAGREGDRLIGIAAPHVSFEGGREAYRAAYRILPPGWGDRTLLVLGTSHYGEPGRFGLTRKPYRTPLGESSIDLELVDLLVSEGGPAVRLEDYCHAVEHSIEFQVVWLQHRLGPAVRIVPILCGPLEWAKAGRGGPDDSAVEQFLRTLGRIQAESRERLAWVLGIDLAHVGRRYGDPFAVRAGEGRMRAVEVEDRERLRRIADGDAAGFLARLTAAGNDGLRWCGASALYCFLRAVAPARGEVLHYEQWNIDETSVVSFAGLAFSSGESERSSRC